MPRYLYSVIWLIGFLVISYYFNPLKLELLEEIAITYNIKNHLYIELMYVFMGIYISLLFINLKVIDVKYPYLLVVFLPLFIFSVIKYFVTIPVNFEMISMICGLSLMIGLFQLRNPSPPPNR
ncbi:hypothetical protein DNH61_24500 [Paenibacillus sambharensis]|uniref:Uncharacterized protein n=1 Tax=Paenibacillus sambharensis TaxID=1803190 RepID=A0A2W1L2Z1_9BACL|nr:hypothetical protein DNH61_24500 [Paenibacillus sambharensis]